MVQFDSEDRARQAALMVVSLLLEGLAKDALEVSMYETPIRL